jgi:hypothetical protein
MLFARVRCPTTDLCALQLSKINWKHWEGVLPKAYVAKLKASYDTMEAPDSSAEIKQRLAALEHNKKLVPAPSTDDHHQHPTTRARTHSLTHTLMRARTHTSLLPCTFILGHCSTLEPLHARPYTYT